MARKKIPNALIDAETYFNGSNDLAGISEVELPNIEYDTVTSEQMGLTAKIKMDCVDESLLEINNEKSILIECKGAAQATNRQSHGADVYGIDATFKGLIKKMDGLKMKPSGKLETSIDLSVTYYKLEIGGKTVIEIDVLNNVNVIHGLANEAIRRYLGLN